jgi:hypothetical protein
MPAEEQVIHRFHGKIFRRCLFRPLRPPDGVEGGRKVPCCRWWCGGIYLLTGTDLPEAGRTRFLLIRKKGLSEHRSAECEEVALSKGRYGVF